MSACELVLSYERDLWVARGAGVELEHRELRGLEALIEARFSTHTVPVEVRLTFDTAALPSWVRQYHSHYCNYTLRCSQGVQP